MSICCEQWERYSQQSNQVFAIYSNYKSTIIKHTLMIKLKPIKNL